MANSEIISPVYKDETAQENGKKLDTIAILLGNIAASQRAIANAQPEVSMDVDLNTVRQIVASGAAPKIYPLGTQLVNTYTDKDGKTYSCPCDVVQPDDTAEGETGSTAPALTMQMHYATLYDIPFSANQAFYIVPEAGLPAGTYHVTFGFNWGTNVKTGTTWQFTTSKALAAGTLLCGFYNAPDVAITSCKVYAYKDQYKSELLDTCTVSSGDEGTDLGTFMQKENGDLNSLQAVAYGDNRWWKSVYRQWLNSDQPATKWWTPQDKWDMMPDCAKTIPGFLAGFSEDFKNALTRTKVVTYGNTVTDDGSAVITYDKVFLPSLEEIYCNPQVKGEGAYWPYWKEATGATAPQALWQTYPLRITRDLAQPTVGRYVRLRSAHRGDANTVFYVNSVGYVSDWGATNTLRSAPACKITTLGQ